MTNEELLVRLDERVKALDDKLDAILTQTLKTNGRVNNHANQLQDLRLWQAEQRGQWKGIAAMSALVGAIIGGIINYIKID